MSNYKTQYLCDSIENVNNISYKNIFWELLTVYGNYNIFYDSFRQDETDEDHIYWKKKVKELCKRISNYNNINI